jgi:hypothetical protein
MVQLLDINDAGNYQSIGTTQARLDSTVSQIGPMADTWHIENAPGPVGYSAPYQPPPSNVSKFTGFVGHIASSIGNISSAAGEWLTHNAVEMAKAPINLGADLAHLGLTIHDLNANDQQANDLGARLDNLVQQYKSGKISQHDYLKALDNWNQENNFLQREINGNRQRLTATAHQSVNSSIQVASDIVTVLTGGFAKGAEVGVKGAAAFAASDAAKPFIEGAARELSTAMTDPAAFRAFNTVGKFAIQHSVAEVAAQGGNFLTAAQLARASVVNLAFKYPIYYNLFSSTGADIYSKLDKKEYGAAVQSAAFNALLLLSGGPIGQAIKYGGKFIGGVSARTFGNSAFLDELSRGIGNGDPAGLYKAILGIKDPAAREEAVRLISHAEATNLAAVGGHESVAAAQRVLQGMRNTYGIDLSQSTHEAELTNMINHFKAQELADKVAKRLGLGPITVGRFDPAMKGEIANELLRGTNADERLALWEKMKLANPNQAWANNINLDKQMIRLIKEHESATALGGAIMGIKARFAVAGFTDSELSGLAKLGYIPIQPKTLSAPFKEGSGKLATAFSGRNDDLFIKASQPLPVLGHIGAMLTNFGLSPNAATNRVYQIFNIKLADELGKLKIGQPLLGDSAEQHTDILIKRLSDYAKNPASGKVFVRPAFTDLRQLGVKDIAKALDISRGQAKDVQVAINRAMLQVPLDIRGLGDKAVDLAYPALRKFLRVQGIGRFSYNPFFQYLRVIPKTEILTEAKGGGVLRSIFAGSWDRIGAIRQELRGVGAFEETGHLGSVTSGEAADYVTSAGRNLNRKLLPMQERSIAGLVDAQAERMGMDYKEYIATYPEQVRNTVQAVAQYDKNANFLNSPLIKTLNVAIFPFRFETKVATVMAKALGQANPVTQVAFIKGLMQAHDYLNSPEGQAWYSQNSEAIGLFKYITPVATLNEVFESLLPGHDHHLGNFGELGGLPFGFIPMLTDSMGLTNFKQPGVEPKTGAIYPEYIPISDRGRLAVTISDFLGGLFGYPGATIGLPSKGSITRNAANAITGANTKQDFTKVTPTISPQQQEFSNTIQALNAPTPVQSATSSIPPQPVPVTESSATQPNIKPNTKAGTRRKSSFTPALLPGQTSYGQL